jgi:hypothetical protein
MSQSYEFRIVIIGAGSVGKTALTTRFVFGSFSEKVCDPIHECVLRTLIFSMIQPSKIHTGGCGVFLLRFRSSFKNCQEWEVDGVSCILDVIDSWGQEDYSAMRNYYMKTGMLDPLKLLSCLLLSRTYSHSNALRSRIPPRVQRGIQTKLRECLQTEDKYQ